MKVELTACSDMAEDAEGAFQCRLFLVAAKEAQHRPDAERTFLKSSHLGFRRLLLQPTEEGCRGHGSAAPRHD